MATHVIRCLRQPITLLILIPLDTVGGFQPSPFQHLKFTAMWARNVVITLIAFLECLINTAGAFHRGCRTQDDLTIPEGLRTFDTQRNLVPFRPGTAGRIAIYLIKENDAAGDAAKTARAVCSHQSQIGTVGKGLLQDGMVTVFRLGGTADSRQHRRISQHRGDFGFTVVFRIFHPRLYHQDRRWIVRQIVAHHMVEDFGVPDTRRFLHRHRDHRRIGDGIHNAVLVSKGTKLPRLSTGFFRQNSASISPLTQRQWLRRPNFTASLDKTGCKTRPGVISAPPFGCLLCQGLAPPSPHEPPPGSPGQIQRQTMSKPKRVIGGHAPGRSQ
ncbi:hypothetical protein D3C80_753890 [compost metagenome]